MSWEDEDRVYAELAMSNDARILLLVLDGLGDIPGARGCTPLEAARTPHLDELARLGSCGVFDPVAPGLTPGSGPGHLGLFGYDALAHPVGRGVLAALGIDFPLQPQDVAARFNFCTLDGSGKIVDRRAGRISTDTNRELVEKLRSAVSLSDDACELFLETVSEHRGLLVLRGEGLGAELNDTDPQVVGVAPQPVQGRDEASERSASLIREALEEIGRALADESSANGILLRGFDCMPDIRTLPERFKLRPVCLAQYPMYRGLARLVGMDVAAAPSPVEALPDALMEVWDHHDLFFLHVKHTDKAGEDGDFDRKVAVIEQADEVIPHLLARRPEVVVVTSDHSTPAALAAHSWHPVPSLLWAPATVRPDTVATFGERSCVAGGLGRQRLRYLLPIALAHAGKLKKFGA